MQPEGVALVRTDVGRVGAAVVAIGQWIPFPVFSRWHNARESRVCNIAVPTGLVWIIAPRPGPAFQRLAQRILVVDCDESIQIARVIRQGRMRDTEVRAVIAQQAPRAERLQLADDVIHNKAGLENLAAQVAVLHEGYSKGHL